jgi:hypothetical protein
MFPSPEPPKRSRRDDAVGRLRRERLVARLRRRAMPTLRGRARQPSRAVTGRSGSRGDAAGARRPAGFAPLERVLRRCASSQGGDTVVHRHLNVSALLRASFVRFIQRSAPGLHAVAADASAPRAIAVLERLTLLQRERLAPSTDAPIALRAAAALLVRFERLPTAGGAALRAGVGPAAERGIAAPVPRLPAVLLRTQPAAAPRLPAAARGDRPADAPWAAPRTPRAAPTMSDSVEPVVLPPRELSRVTDHVIRQLDRRIVSYAERTGRN